MGGKGMSFGCQVLCPAISDDYGNLFVGKRNAIPSRMTKYKYYIPSKGRGEQSYVGFGRGGKDPDELRRIPLESEV